MDSDHSTRLAVDAIGQSGLRANTVTVLNGVALPAHAVFNLSIMQKLASCTELRLDILNIGNVVYRIRNALGVCTPQYGICRTILAGVTQRF